MATTATTRRRRRIRSKAAARKITLAVASASGARPEPPSPLTLVRNASGYTIVRLARRIRVNPSTISLIENGLCTPSAALVERLCDALDVDANTLGFPKPKEAAHAR